jgi:hypothetical protein
MCVFPLSRHSAPLLLPAAGRRFGRRLLAGLFSSVDLDFDAVMSAVKALGMGVGGGAGCCGRVQRSSKNFPYSGTSESFKARAICMSISRPSDASSRSNVVHPKHEWSTTLCSVSDGRIASYSGALSDATLSSLLMSFVTKGCRTPTTTIRTVSIMTCVHSERRA